MVLTVAWFRCHYCRQQCYKVQKSMWVYSDPEQLSCRNLLWLYSRPAGTQSLCGQWKSAKVAVGGWYSCRSLVPGQFVPGALRELSKLWSSPGFRRMQKLRCVKRARVPCPRSTCWQGHCTLLGSSERVLPGAGHRAGVAPRGLGGFCSLLNPWRGSVTS